MCSRNNSGSGCSSLPSLLALSGWLLVGLVISDEAA